MLLNNWKLVQEKTGKQQIMNNKRSHLLSTVWGHARIIKGNTRHTYIILFQEVYQKVKSQKYWTQKGKSLIKISISKAQKHQMIR